MTFEEFAGPIRYEVIDQSFLADEVMSILNLSGREYAAKIEMQLLERTRNLRETVHSRLIHSGWDILQYVVVHSLVHFSVSPHIARSAAVAVLDILSEVLERHSDFETQALLDSIAQDIYVIVVGESVFANQPHSGHLAESIVRCLGNCLTAISSYICVADVEAVKLFDDTKRINPLYGAGSEGVGISS